MMQTENDIYPDYCTCRVLVLGCGNILLGDDGFGPAVIEYLLRDTQLPDDVYCMNTGTSVRKILFNIELSEIKPERIIIVDCMDYGGKPGEMAEIPLDAIPLKKTDDFSMHQVPTSNLLKELKDICELDVRIVVCQPAVIPEEVAPGLSEVVEKALGEAAVMLVGMWEKAGDSD